jgi:hypothetical protein
MQWPTIGVIVHAFLLLYFYWICEYRMYLGVHDFA